MEYVLESLEGGDPRNWDHSTVNQSNFKFDRALKDWRQDVWWMFYQQDPFLTELFSLESICAHLATTFRITLTADGVRESCFRQGLCPPESKIANRRCKKAKIVPLGAIPEIKKSLKGVHQERDVIRVRRWGSW